MDNLLKIWKAIVKETETSQESEGFYKGLVKNFLINGFYYRETAFAAKIFAAEFKRTKDEKFLQRAQWAIQSIQRLFNKKKIIDGLDDPVLTPRGLRYRRGSIPATILLLESILETIKIISYKFEFNKPDLVSYLKKCYIGKGRFYHDVIEDEKRKYHHIINTTAMAYFSLEFLSKDSEVKNQDFYKKEISKIRKAIISSVRSDGFFPYIEPHRFQRLFFLLSKFIPRKIIKLYDRILKDCSIFFGDAIHHTISIYYLLKSMKYTNKRPTDRELKVITKSWLFIRKNLKEYQNGYMLFDFSWEPKPDSYRHCNFIDTTTYFYILDLLRYLNHFSIISSEELLKYRNGIINHIAQKLLVNDVPSINAYEGDEEIKEKIIPRPSETVFNKGALIAETVIEIYEGTLRGI